MTAIPRAFLSYAHSDDEFLEGRITRLRQELQLAIRFVSGQPFEIFQDKDGIAFGQHWRERLDEALAASQFLIPILTPNWFASPACREEAEKFLAYEAAAGRRDLILPIYLWEVEILESADQRARDPIALALIARQYDDWRQFALVEPSSAAFKTEVLRLARSIAEAAKWRGPIVAPSSPAAPTSSRDALPRVDQIGEVVERELALSQTVMVRRRPNARALVLQRLERGASLYVTGRLRRKEWYRVELEGGEAGYIHAHALGEDPGHGSAEQLAPVDVQEFGTGKSHRDSKAGWYPKIAVVQKGGFLMGSRESDTHTRPCEMPQHWIGLRSGFALGCWPVTFDEYDEFCAASDRQIPFDEGWGRGRRPVINVSWEDAQAYCAWLSGRTGKSYRLPSEAEWEYACRTNTVTSYSWGDTWTDDKANFGRAIGRTTEVGSYPANQWGFFDMHGNVWEWCADTWHDSYDGAPEDGAAWTARGDQGQRVLRGGAWNAPASRGRAAARSPGAVLGRSFAVGFRVVRDG
jgi:formylglycine-generating enzyme required for sulfatase activity